jgi:RimJ/RimL family protein N-acetyltransferase
MIQSIEFETERLSVRQWRDSDREPFAALCSDPKVMEFMGTLHDRATSDGRIDKWSARIQEVGWGVWAVELKQGGEFIGFTGLQVPAEGHPFLPCVELGWRLAAAHWGRGYATEAANGVLRVAFDALALPELIATTAVGNRRSSEVMKRLGMRGPELTFQLPRVPEDNLLGRHVLFRLSREQWRADHDTQPVIAADEFGGT